MGLAYSRAGAGPPLVLFHGVGHRRQAWDVVLDRLTPHRDVITVDLPGHGDSPPLDVSHRSVLEALADDVIGLLDKLGLDRPHIGGNSLGGLIALEAALFGRAASVTALSPAGFWRSDRELAYVKGVFRTMQALGARLAPVAPRLSRSAAGRTLLYATIVSRPGRMSPQQAEEDLAAFLAAKPALDLILAAAAPYHGEIPPHVPVTIGWGSKDRLLSPRQALVARDRLPHATFIRLPGCGHVPMTDDPELVAKVLLRGSSRPEISSPVTARADAAPPR
ncbi:MAG TPA: alpha/beta hydrolase [Streptosporangiaceae bacterium]|nr:alpha/beta hydrolase [Streptosporangiaceae bacterium]